MSLRSRLLRCPAAVRGLALLGIVSLAAAAAPLLAPADPASIDPGSRLLAPMSRSTAEPDGRPAALHLLGTDSVGRDILSRLVFGSRISLSVGFAAVFLGAIFGGLIGLFGGYFGGVTDALTGWLIDVQLSFPFLLLAIFVLGALGGGTAAVVVVLALGTWPNYARIVRAQVLSIRNQGYVESARTVGAGLARILFIHVLPNTLAPVCIVASFSMAQAILTEAGLSFLGVGLDPSTPSWGTMLNDGRDYLLSAWWIATVPGITVGFTVFAVMQFGEGLREALDPRSSL